MENMVPNNFYRVSAKALILNKDNKFLLVKEENGLWEFPGGGLDFGETPQEGIKRELAEEMGLEVTEVAPKPSYFITSVNIKGIHIANVFYETEVKDLNFTPSEECIEIRFFSKEEAEQETNTYPNIKEFIKFYQTI